MPATSASDPYVTTLGPSLQIGVSLPTWENRDGHAPDWAELVMLARQAEAIGVDTIWVADHLQTRPTTGFWECWTVLTALAGVTNRVTLGPHVLCTAYRNPGLTARMSATLDEISGGRLILGLGAGDPGFDASWAMYGFPSDHQVSRFAESLEIIARMFREETVDFQGTYAEVNGGSLRPSGPRPGGPPIWVAARGPRMMRLAARWADAINYEAPGTTPDDLRDIFARLDDACLGVGRDPATIARTASALISFASPERCTTGVRAQALRGSPAEISSQLLALQEAGAQHLTCWIDDGDSDELNTAWPRLTTRGLNQFALVIAALRATESSPK